MSGCNWQDKTFSVAVSSGKKEYTCCVCHKETDTPYLLNGEKICKECFSNKPSKGTIGCNTEKDLRYQFKTDMFDGKEIEIHSKRQFKGLLKKYGMADASPKECMQEAKFRKNIVEEDRKLYRKKKAVEIFNKKRSMLRSNYGRDW